MLGVHDPQAFDIAQAEFGDALLRLAQHRRGNIDAAKPAVLRIMRQRNSGADADFENAPADALGGGDRGVPAALEDRAEDEVIDRRPPRIGFGDHLIVQIRVRQSAHA